MALLHYQNLGLQRPDKLLQSAFYGLQPFFQFLDRTKKFMESPKSVLRLAWSPVQEREDVGEHDDGRDDGVWVQLDESLAGRDVPETTLRAFLDEDVREVYEEEALDEGDAIDRRSTAGRVRFQVGQKIRVLGRYVESQQLMIERLPKSAHLMLRPNTWTLQCQLKALKALQDSPTPDHLPLLRLLQPNQHAAWPWFSPTPVVDWMVLSKLERQGTDQQRRFVEIALATPDFAILEGPPGSGKTTAICELVLQLAKAGKRVLLCASTHVAVDNVLERLMAAHNLHRDLVIPVRIGDERNPNIAEGVRDWQLQRFLRTERRRLLAMLEGRKPLSDAQLALRDELRQGETAIERLVLEAANLVCGTTIGILQHPDLKARSRDRAEAAFDVLILDEASKTTFQEFLVPAMWAKRWVIVGDPKQLSPFVDEDAMASNIEACLPDGAMRDACVDVFEAAKGGIIAVASDAESAHHAYFEQAQARGVTCANVGDEGAPFAQIVVGSRAALEANLDRLPLDVGIVRAPDGSLDVLRRRAAAWWHVGKLRPDEPRDWAQEVGWRLASSYELRWTKTQSQLGQRRTATERLGEEINSLLPAVEGDDRESVWQRVDQVRRVALPSLLESLQHGFERSSAQHGTALTDGIPADHLHRRHVLLAAQHRMHPEIAAFSSQHVYKGEALHTPVYLEAERQWSYGRYARRSVWQHCDGKTTPWNSNTEEVQMVRRELAKFDEWAATNPRPDGRPWEVAVLTFYRGQERELRQELRRWSGLHHARGRFLRGPKAQPYLAVDLCTVDRFQGHEADLVILSIAKSRATYFLESPNRWNVALTRARYQRVIVGNRHGFSRASGLLGELARDPSWEQSRPEGQV